MPTSLPSNPNLDHLKKQAKALLRAYRRNEPETVEKFGAFRLKSAPKLSDAQHLVAKEYGFESWPTLKAHVESLGRVSDVLWQEARKAFKDDDVPTVRRMLEQHPELRARINEPVGDFDSLPINNVRSVDMLDVLLDAGADINARSRWWAGGFNLLECARPDIAAHAVRRGADVTVHAAARLGMVDRLRDLINADPDLVHARGGDGQTPLHMASSIAVAEYLLDHGAEIDARDVDHESTPAQYMVRSRQEVARYLIRRGCTTDILMATALGDVDLVQKHLSEDPESVRMRVSDEYVPMVGSGKGGTIYQWELGWYVSARQVARSFGHAELFDLLMDRSPTDEKLIDACWLHEEGLVQALLDKHENVAAALPPALRRHLAHAARNNDTAAARLMVDAGLPLSGAFSQHRGSALHWAAWHGNAELVRRFLRQDPSLEDADNEFNSAPLGWAIHGSEHGWDRVKGDYPATVDALLEAGALPPETAHGTPAVKALLRHYGVR